MTDREKDRQTDRQIDREKDIERSNYYRLMQYRCNKEIFDCLNTVISPSFSCFAGYFFSSGIFTILMFGASMSSEISNIFVFHRVTNKLAALVTKSLVYLVIISC